MSVTEGRPSSFRKQPPVVATSDLQPVSTSVTLAAAGSAAVEEGNRSLEKGRTGGGDIPEAAAVSVSLDDGGGHRSQGKGRSQQPQGALVASCHEILGSQMSLGHQSPCHLPGQTACLPHHLPPGAAAALALPPSGWSRASGLPSKQFRAILSCLRRLARTVWAENLALADGFEEQASTPA